MSTPPRRLTQPMVVKIYELIKPRLRKVANSDLWEYEQDWSDARVSEALKSENISSHHVAQVRAKLFGHISAAKSAAGARTSVLADQQAAIMATLIRLEAKLDHLTREVGSRPWEPRLLNGPRDAYGVSSGPAGLAKGSSQER